MTDAIRTAESLPPPPAIFHFIGIGGIGMSGLARILTMWGYKVTGSDAMESAQTAALRAMGIPVVIGHDDPSFASLADIIVTNKRAAANAKIELDAGEANGARVIKRGDLLGMAANEKFGIAVAGSHGKSTTSGMLSVALRTLDADPTFAVGAIVAATGTNAEPGNGDHFVVEADEFDRSFHGLFPNVAIITSVAFDHPDIYDDQDDYDQSFVEFVGNMKSGGTLIIAGDDPGAERVTAEVSGMGRDDLSVQTFGDLESFDWSLVGDANNRTLVDPQGRHYLLHLRMPGKHNARNAIAAIAALHASGFSVEDAIRGVESFTGIGRRFEYKGTIAGTEIEVIDDYAHHPEEVAAVLHAAREHYPGKRIVAVHQPHTFSRTYSLMNEFAAALDLADDVVLMEIYGVGEVNEHDISSATLAEKMSRVPVIVDTPEEAAAATRALTALHADAVVLTLGAGTITNVGPLLVDAAPTSHPATVGAPSTTTERKTGTSALLGDLDVAQQAPMSLYTTMRVGGPAEYLVRASTPEQIVSAVRTASASNLPLTIIGGGSNLLVSDDGISGLVVVARVPGARSDDLITIEDAGDSVNVKVAATVPSSWLGKFAADNGIAGLDWLVGLPGQLGGALVNNAGAHGEEIKNGLVSIELLYPDGSVDRQDASWLQASYRSTRLKEATRPREQVILGAEFVLPKGDTAELKQRAANHAAFRRDTQPSGACSGSVFANPDNHFAARLVEAAGLKGHQIGGMQISPIHANWIINQGNGTASDAWTLVEAAMSAVTGTTGINLRPEIERIGNW